LETGRLIEREVIRKRMDAYGINVKDGVLEVFSGSEAEDVKKIELSKTEDLMEVKVKDSSIITRGSCASKGIVKGIARVILSPNEYQRFKQGDILITSMTTPDYSMILQNAAAIVTDEGGLTCHAAIISRELGIPCITGTKNATKRIADGEVIKVDADKGTVCREEME
jgi:pyruvate,water dikinase